MTTALIVPLLALAQATAAPQPVAIEGATAYVYKTAGDVQLRLHVFTTMGASASNRKPAIVFFFGGGWTNGSRSEERRVGKECRL